jgi:hypothetical protein
MLTSNNGSDRQAFLNEWKKDPRKCGLIRINKNI